jgi:hypothetical protein
MSARVIAKSDSNDAVAYCKPSSSQLSTSSIAPSLSSWRRFFVLDMNYTFALHALDRVPPVEIVVLRGDEKGK